VLAFTEEEMWRIFKIMAALLHLGNVSFQGTISYFKRQFITRTTGFVSRQSDFDFFKTLSRFAHLVFGFLANVKKKLFIK
jgi:hypothetical protein